MKKAKEPKMKKEKKSTSLGFLITFVLVLVVVVLGYTAMIKIETNVLSNYEKEAICVVTNDIAKGTVITEDNVSKYIDNKEIDKSITPSDAVVDVATLYDRALKIDVKAGTPLTESMLYSVDNILATMKNPKELSLSLSDLVQGVSGIIRTGDYIDVYILEKANTSYSLSGATEQSTYKPAPILSHVYVSGAFDSNGTEISNSDNVTACQRVNVIIEEESAQTIYSKILNGYVYAVKEVDETDISEK